MFRVNYIGCTSIRTRVLTAFSLGSGAWKTLYISIDSYIPRLGSFICLIISIYHDWESKPTISVVSGRRSASGIIPPCRPVVMEVEAPSLKAFPRLPNTEVWISQACYVQWPWQGSFLSASPI